MENYTKDFNENNNGYTTNSEKMFVKYHGYPRELSELLSEAECCKEVLKAKNYSEWIHSYSDCAGCFTMIGRVSREYILISLAHVLNEIKELIGFQLEHYLNDTPGVLMDIIMKSAEIKGWKLNRDFALGLCSKIISDYMEDRIRTSSEPVDETLSEDGIIVVDQQSETSALEQIIESYTDDMVLDMFNPVWEWLCVELKYEGEKELNDEELQETYDLKLMKTDILKGNLLPRLAQEMVI